MTECPVYEGKERQKAKEFIEFECDGEKTLHYFKGIEVARRNRSLKKNYDFSRTTRSIATFLKSISPNYITISLEVFVPSFSSWHNKKLSNKIK